MKLTIDDDKIKINDELFVKLDGSDLDENKLLTIFSSIKEKQNIEIDDIADTDNRNKCELIKMLLDEYINNYFEQESISIICGSDSMENGTIDIEEE